MPIQRSRSYTVLVHPDWDLTAGVDELYRLFISPGTEMHAGVFLGDCEEEAGMGLVRLGVWLLVSLLMINPLSSPPCHLDLATLQVNKLRYTMADNVSLHNSGLPRHAAIPHS